MRVIRSMAMGLALLATITPAWSAPGKIVKTRAFSPQYKQRTTIVVVAIIRPEVPSIVMSAQGREPGLPKHIIITPYYEMNDKLIGSDQDGRDWCVDAP